MVKEFTLDHYRACLRKLRQMDLFGSGSIPEVFWDDWPWQDWQACFVRMERIIDAMSSEERRAPECIDAARRQHIADHSGSQTDEVERVIRQFMKFQSQMQQINEMTVWQRIKSLFGWSKPPGVG